MADPLPMNPDQAHRDEPDDLPLDSQATDPRPVSEQQTHWAPEVPACVETTSSSDE